MTMNTTDLTLRPPRSPRVRLGGYAILPRILDKARATAAGRAGEYRFNSLLDSLFFGFSGVDAEALLECVKAGAGDAEVLAWVQEGNAKTPEEIHAWSAGAEAFVLTDPEDSEWFAGELRRLDPRRTDIRTVFDYLDLDDYLHFNGVK
jgi:hypothetical protein